jgi:predicted N-acyltransferase
MQFHWVNAGYGAFEDFLSALSSGKRKTIRRERRDALAGRRIRRLQGREITEADWDFFYACYQDTGARKWGSPYLNRSFFSLIGERMGDELILLIAEEAGRPIASALNVLGGDCLYGRYWGRVAAAPFLHFELCYYQAIDIAIELGLPRVEAGAQGEHKLARGYAPVATTSAHWMANQGLHDAVARYLAAERPAIADEIELLDAYTPFRKADQNPL